MNKTKRVLVLEDDPARLQGFVTGLAGTDYKLVCNPAMAIGYLALYEWDVLFLDHDLGGDAFCPSDEQSGFAVACWLSENPARMPGKVILHTWNPAGAENMQAVLPDAPHDPYINAGWVMNKIDRE